MTNVGYKIILEENMQNVKILKFFLKEWPIYKMSSRKSLFI